MKFCRFSRAIGFGFLLTVFFAGPVKASDRHSPQPETSVLVFLNQRAELTEQNFENREARLRYVYETLTEHAIRTQASLREFLDKQSADYRSFYITNMIALYNPSPDLVRSLRRHPDVDRISYDPYFSQDPIQFTPTEFTLHSLSLEGVEPNIQAIGADRVWKEFGVRGQGIVVASQDTGIEWDHPALLHQYRGTRNFFDVEHDLHWHDAISRRNNHQSINSCGYATLKPCDDSGHGTHTLGTILGSSDGNRIGVAPDARWIACRNMDDGDGRPSTYIDCFEYFLAPYPYAGNPFTDGRPELAPDIINNSWGCPLSEGCQGFEMEEVLEVLRFAGIMNVVSAGNDGPGCATIDSQPASHQTSVLTVGALHHRFNSIAIFSSRGPSAWDGSIGPSLVAPGVSIRSAVPGRTYEGGWSGTSMAAPHVAGLVALLWSARPDLRGQLPETIELIKDTAKSLHSRQNCGEASGFQVPNNVFGHGAIDAFAAVKKALEN